MSIRSVLVTGCSAGGIGSAFVDSFLKKGYHVFATARTVSKMPDYEKKENVTVISLDVTSPASIAAAVGIVRETTGGTLDVLVNNSGSLYIMPALDSDIKEGKKMFDVNFWGVLAVTQAFAPLLRAAKGSIINICSMSAVLNSPYTSLYSASKSALTSLGETMRLELAPFGIKVVSVVTGAVQSNLMAPPTLSLRLPRQSLYLPAEKEVVARARGKDFKVMMETSVYTDKVVSDVMGGARGIIWRGTMSSIVRWAFAFLPRFILDRIVSDGSGMSLLK